MSNEKDPLARLIARAGVRQRPSQPMEASVRAATHEAWQQALRHERRQRVMWFSSAAAVAIAMIGGWYINSHSISRSPVMVATLMRTSGDIKVVRSNKDTPQGDVANSASRIYTGEEIDTGEGVALLSLDGNANIRLASHTRLHWQSAGKIMLASGKMYVDSGKPSVPLSIETPLGVVTHLGTRYQVTSSADNLNVSVRDGMVKLVTPGNQLQVLPRQAVNVNTKGIVTRHDIEPHGSQWEWADNLAPRFQFDNRTLAEFLEWVAHETGRTLKYGDTQAQITATQTILHLQGMSESLTPMTALSIVLPTTDFDLQLEGSQLTVHRH